MVNVSYSTGVEYNPEKSIKTINEITSKVTVASGQTLSKGSVVGVVTATNKVIVSIKSASNGSQVPYGITLMDLDASSADLSAQIMVSGIIRESDVSPDASWSDTEELRIALQKANITMKNFTTDAS